MGKDSLCSWMRSSSKNLSSTSSAMNNNQEVKLYVKTKTWIENAEHELLFGKGKTEILELIEQEGSIAKAAEKLEMSYKKAWTHIKILQKNIADELVVPQKGGGGKGGTTLTPKALELVRNYSQLQKDIEAFANRRFLELFFPDQLPAK
jgi:molybdate transport system regulatory protein